jgi:hypothetical protein
MEAVKSILKLIVILLGCWGLVEVTGRLLLWAWMNHEIEMLRQR